MVRRRRYAPVGLPRSNLDSSVEVLEMDNNINDVEFADAVFELFQKNWNRAPAAVSAG